MSTFYDAIVIGTGQAGPALAVRLAKTGKKVAIIERKAIGGTCVNVGCIPSKTLIASARVAYVAKKAGDFGVMIEGQVHVDMKKVKARKDAVVQQSSQGLTSWLKSTPNLTLIEGAAKFTGPKALIVNGSQLSANQIFINVGGRPLIPNIPGLETVSYLTSSTIMNLDALPKHLIIIGGSYIGLEFAQMYRRFGSEVTVIEAGPRIISREEPATSEAVANVLKKEGIAIQTDAQSLRLSKIDDSICLNLTGAGAPVEVSGSHLLLAVGRIPNTSDLGLDLAGVNLDSRGYITVNDDLSTSVPGIWALGDVNGKGAFTHTAYNDYEIVAANLLDQGTRKVSDRIPAYALYTDPPLARIGMNETEALKSGKRILSARLQMARVGRARERGETDGFLSALVDADTLQILGATFFGIEADEAIHSVLDVMSAKQPYTLIQMTMHIHPTVSELIPTLFESLKPL